MNKPYVFKQTKNSKDLFNKIKENLSQQKLELIRSYSDDVFLNLINDIKTGKNLRELQNLLDFYVPINLANNKNNQVKYGIKTKQAFIESFKKSVESSTKNKDFAEREKSEFIYTSIYKLSLIENLEKINGFSKYLDTNISSLDFLETFLEWNKKGLCPKEYIEKWYKFDPCIDINEEIEAKINNLTYSLSDLNNKVLLEENEELRQKILKQNELLDEQKQIIKVLKLDQGKEKAIFDNKVNHLEEEKLKLQKQNDEKFQKINELKYKIEILDKEKDEAQIAHKLVLSEKESQLAGYISRLEEYATQLQKYKDATIDLDNNLENKNKKLLESSEYIDELLKEIKSYENQIDEYEAQIEEYEEQIESYEEFIKNNEEKNAEFNTKVNEILDLKEKIFNMEKALNRTIAFKAQDIETKLYSDRKYQQILLSLILSDTRGGNAVIKYLNLKDEIIKSRSDAGGTAFEKRAELVDLQKSIEALTKEKENLKIEIRKKLTLLHSENKKDVTKKTELYKYKKQLGFDPRIAYSKFEKNLAEFYTNGDLTVAQSYFRKLATGDNFVIVDNDKFLDAFNLESYGIDICRVSAEPSWNSIDDWFGKFDNEGVFIPAKTQIADYYSFVKNTPELPFGFIVIDNFNLIPPEIYLIPFIDDIVHNGFKNLIHRNLVKSGEEYARIEKLPNLKFILIKSSNDNFAFEIPQSLRKYELNEVK